MILDLANGRDTIRRVTHMSPKRKPPVRTQTAQLNVRMTAAQLETLEAAVAKLQTEKGQPGARFSLSKLLLDAGIAEAEKILGTK